MSTEINIDEPEDDLKINTYYPNTVNWDFNNYIGFNLYIARYILSEIYGQKDYSKAAITERLGINHYQTITNIETKGMGKTEYIKKMESIYISMGFFPNQFINPTDIEIDFQDKPYIIVYFNADADPSVYQQTYEIDYEGNHFYIKLIPTTIININPSFNLY